MSKPEDIPQDVWDAARAAIEAEVTNPGWNPQVIVARAIMAERERCAHIAYCAYDWKTEICSRIVRKIRSGVER